MPQNKIKKAGSTRLLISLIALSSTLISPLCYAESTNTSSPTRVYKVVHPDGSVSYSDQPQHNAEEMLVQPIPTVPALKLEESTLAPPAGKPSLDSSYTDLSIVKPANNSAFHSGSPGIDVAVKLSPPLQPAHKLRFSLDGQERTIQKGTQLVLKEVHRGSHKLKVEVIDAQERVLKTATSNFTLHRPIARPPRVPVSN